MELYINQTYIPRNGQFKKILGDKILFEIYLGALFGSLLVHIAVQSVFEMTKH